MTEQYEFLPKLLQPTDEDFEVASKLLRDSSEASLNEWARERTEVLPLSNDRSYRMLIDRPEGGDENKVVVVGGEFGNGIKPTHTMRARIVRDLVAPEATLVVQPNPEIDQLDNLNLSGTERLLLRYGRIDPLLGRLANVLSGLNNPSDITFYGPSQGGVLALAYGAHENTPAAGIAVVDTPDVENRSTLKLLKGFAGSGADLKDVIAKNGEGVEGSVFMRETLDGVNLRGLGKYALGLLHKDNLALRGILRRNTAQLHMDQILQKGGSIIHAHGTKDGVSPLDGNRAITSQLAHHDHYRAAEFKDHTHAMTNLYVVNGALTRAAYRLMHQDAA
jgi:hypothetical protein